MNIQDNRSASAMVCMCLLAAGCFAYAQAPDTLWTRTYGGSAYDVGRSVIRATDGGYIICGSTFSFGAGLGDIYLVKTDSTGDTLWSRAYGGPESDVGTSVIETFDLGYVIVGYTDSWGAGQFDVCLMKTDMNGDTLWTRTYGGTLNDFGRSIVQTSDSGYVLTGTTNSFGAGWEDVYLIKTDREGDTIWTRTFGWNDSDYGNSITLAHDGGYVIGGTTYSTPTHDGDVYVIKTDEHGNYDWSRTYGGDNYQWGAPIATTTDGGYIATGETTVSAYTKSLQPSERICASTGHIQLSSRLQDTDVWILKLNAAGDTIWTRHCGGQERDVGFSVQETSEGGYTIAGGMNMFSSPSDADVFQIKTDVFGDTAWTQVYGGTHNDCGYSVQQTPDNGYAIAGYTESFGNGDADIWLLRTEPDVGIHESRPPHPSSFALQISPNPFNDETGVLIRIRSGASSVQALPANVNIYDLSGCLVKHFPNVVLDVSCVTLISWKGQDDLGREMPSGIYFVELVVRNCREVRKFVRWR